MLESILGSSMHAGARLDAGQFPGNNGGQCIQAAIDSLGEKHKMIEVGPNGPDEEGCWLLTKAIVIPSNTTLVLHGARLFMANGASDNIIRNFRAESNDSRRDQSIHIIGIGSAELNGNAENQVRQAQVYKNFGIAFYKVDQSSIKGIAVGPTEAWGIGLEDVNDIFVDGIRFHQDGKTHNQDGIHVCGPGSRICISNVIGTVADDAVALDAGAGAEDYRGSARGSGGFLQNIVVSNVAVKNLGAGAAVRTVAARGKALDGVFISQIMITDANQVLKIGWDRWGAKQGGREIGDVFPSCDEHKNIVIDGVHGSTQDVFCRIESNVKNLTIRNVRGRCGATAFTNITPDGDFSSLENVLLENWVLDGCKLGIEIAGGANCSNFTVKDSVFTAEAGQDNIGIRLAGQGETLNVNKMLFDNVVLEGFSRGLQVTHDVQIADAVRIVNSDFNGSRNEIELPKECVKFKGMDFD